MLNIDRKSFTERFKEQFEKLRQKIYADLYNRKRKAEEFKNE